jgi:hypothetical protein
MRTPTIDFDPARHEARPRRALLRGCVVVAVLALGIADATAGAGRTRPGGSGGAPRQRAAGRATYGHGGHYPGHHGGHHGYYGYYGYRYYPYYYGWAAWPWGWYGGWPYYAGWPYYVYRDGSAPANSGVIETDVRPRKAEVRVDGQFVGQARDFNGRWDYLWLEPGEHVLEFSKEGYMTLRRVLDVRAGMQVRVRERLAKGEGTDPRSSERPAPTAEVEPGSSTPAPASPDLRAASGTLRRGLLRLDVEPSDAAVYLDGEFLARAGELRRLHGALPVADGVHTVEVVRPGYDSRSVEVEVKADEPARVEIVLVRQE